MEHIQYNWKRDGLIIGGLVVVVAVGYLIFKEKPPQPRAQASAQMAGHDNMPADMLQDMPGDYGSLVLYGNQQMDRENYAIAAEAYRRALTIDGSSPDVRSDFASCLHGMGLPKRAEEEFRRIIADHPDHTVSYFNLGVVQHQLGESDSARIYWKKYLAMDPTGPASAAAQQFLKELEN